MKKIVLVAAARPNFMKIAPIARELDKYAGKFEYKIVHTGQHYDRNMSQSFFEQLSIPTPDIDLEVGSGTHAEQTANVMIKFEKFLMEYKPDLVLVVGDVNSTMACSIAAAKLNIAVAHVEAGLRSFDRNMPEEINRLLTDSIADILYTPSEDGDEQLLKEGHPKEKIVFVGNVMIDTLDYQKAKADKLSYYDKLGLKKGNYVLLTMHRPSNVDDSRVFKDIIDALTEISKEYTIVFPAHPRTKGRISEFGFDKYFNFDGVKQLSINIVDPVGYNEMLSLNMNSKLVITDSGGLQEETTAVGIPCMTIRENTERPITVEEGTNYLVGIDPKNIIDTYKEINSSSLTKGGLPKYWDGKASERIVSHLIEYFNN